MHPTSVLLANVSNFIQWIECAQHRCAGRGRHKERNLSSILVLDNLTFQFAGNHSTGRIRCDHYAIVRTQSTDRCTRFNRIMTLIRCEHDQFAGQTLCSVLFVIGKHSMASRQKGIQIRDRTTRRQNGVTTIPSDQFTHLGEHNGFHEYENGRNFVREHVCVGRGRQPFAGHRNQIQSARKLIEKVWMTCGRT